MTPVDLTAGDLPSRLPSLRQVCRWLAAHEGWLALPAVLLLLFPFGWLPWLALAWILLLWVARWLSAGRLSVRTGLELPITLLLLCAGMGLAVSLAPALSWSRFWSLLAGMALFYAFANMLASQPQRIQVFYLLGILTLGWALLSLLAVDWSYSHMLPLPSLYQRIPSLLRGLPGSGIAMQGHGTSMPSDLLNPRWVGISMGFLSPFFLGVLFFAPGAGLRLFSGAVSLAALLLLLLSQSLQGLVALAGGLAFLVVWRWRWLGALVLAVFAGVLLGAGWCLLRGAPFQRLLELALRQDNFLGIAVVLRLDIWSRALAMLHDMPFTGVGLNTFPLVLSQFYPGFLLGPEPHAHSLYLQTALDFGLIGLFALLWLVVAWYAGLFQRRRLLERARAASGAASRAAFPAGTAASRAVMAGSRAAQSAVTPSVLASNRAAESAVTLAVLAGCGAALSAFLAAGLVDGMMLGAKPVTALWLILAVGAAPLLSTLSASQPASAQGSPAPGALPVAPPAGSPARRSSAWSVWLPLALLALGLAAFLWRDPAAFWMNLGALRVRPAILAWQQGAQPAAVSLDGARLSLQKALAIDPQRTFALDLLSRLAAWQGAYDAALAYTSRRLELDRRDPWIAYFPPEALLRRFNAQPLYNLEGDQALLRIYSHWMNRYPARAEGCLRLALLQSEALGQPEQAAHTLQQGLDQGAQPAGFLIYAGEILSR